MDSLKLPPLWFRATLVIGCISCAVLADNCTSMLLHSETVSLGIGAVIGAGLLWICAAAVLGRRAPHPVAIFAGCGLISACTVFFTWPLAETWRILGLFLAACAAAAGLLHLICWIVRPVPRFCPCRRKG